MTTTFEQKKERVARFDRAAVLPALWRGTGAGPAHHFQPRCDAQFRHGADACRQPHAGLHDRDRRRRHDAGHRDGRHRSVGRLADGDCRRAVAHVLHGPAVPGAQSLCRHCARHRLSDPDRRRRLGSSMAGSSPGSPSSRSLPRWCCSSRAAASRRFRPTATCRFSRFPSSRPLPLGASWRSLPGVDHAGDRCRRGLCPAQDGVRAAGAGGGRQRGGGAAFRHSRGSHQVPRLYDLRHVQRRCRPDRHRHELRRGCQPHRPWHGA